MFAGSTWPSPNERMPGVSMTQPAAGRPAARSSSVAYSRSATEDEEVCRPRPVTALTTPVGPLRVGHQRVDQRGLADAGVPDRDRRPPEQQRAEGAEVAAAGGREEGQVDRRELRDEVRVGSARSVFVTSTSGSMPASNAATR